ncbi:MAG: malate synthase A [Chloroflexota bacterium]|nr:malate synthase A [Chloroflexota bacterium]
MHTVRQAEQLPPAPPEGVELRAPVPPDLAAILSFDALRFVAKLHRTFESTRQDLLRRRVERQAELDAGSLPTFLGDTRDVRESVWTVAPVPEDIRDRRVEITGPTDRKMVINALNSGARVFMADFEDANAPTWENMVRGQCNVYDAVRRQIGYTSPDGREYSLRPEIATLFVRPRGWHLSERHLLVDGQPVSGALFDFGLYFFHNARELIQLGAGPYFYLPKLEGHREARLWNEVFVLAQQELDVPQGTIKATVLIETITAAFEMHEILYELREHSAGLNCGRWDYIFSYIKRLRGHPDRLLPDRALVTMTVPFMRAYSLLLIKTCHQREAHAMGGMAAQIPVRGDAAANEAAFAKVREDKEREAADGHDGTWVAHPGLVETALAAFDARMPTANQIDRKREDVRVTADEMLVAPEGPITETGLRTNINVGVRYIESWLRGQGAAPINNLMEDAATAEISRAQVWQWIRSPRAVLDDGRLVDIALVQTLLEVELSRIRDEVGDDAYAAGRFAEASALFSELTENDAFEEFLTVPAYDVLERA